MQHGGSHVMSRTLTAYKLHPAKAVKSMSLRTSGFETDHEIPAKLIRSGHRIVEVPIAYFPRSAEEGKKIKATDVLIAVWTLLKSGLRIRRGRDNTWQQTLGYDECSSV